MVRNVPSAPEARETLRATVARRARELAASDDNPDGGDSGAAVEAFVTSYYAQVVIDDDLLANAEQLARAALAHWRLGAQRPAATPMVSVRTPTAASEDWDAPHTVVDVVTDDMPFVVDSVTMALDRHGLGVHLVVHPVFEVGRDADGRRSENGQ